SCTSCSKEVEDLQTFKTQLEGQQDLRSVRSAVNAGPFQRSLPSRLSLVFLLSSWPTRSRWALAACAMIALGVGIRSVWTWQHKPELTAYSQGETLQNVAGPLHATYLASPSDLPPEFQAIVMDAIRTQRIQTPRSLADLAVRRGGGEEPTHLLAPVGTVITN